jgi:hypothetical protein
MSYRRLSDSRLEGGSLAQLVLVRAIEPSTPLHFSQSVNAAVQPVMSDSNRLSLFFQVTLGEVLPR